MQLRSYSELEALQRTSDLIAPLASLAEDAHEPLCRLTSGRDPNATRTEQPATSSLPCTAKRAPPLIVGGRFSLLALQAKASEGHESGLDQQNTALPARYRSCSSSTALTELVKQHHPRFLPLVWRRHESCSVSLLLPSAASAL